MQEGEDELFREETRLSITREASAEQTQPPFLSLAILHASREEELRQERGRRCSAQPSAGQIRGTPHPVTGALGSLHLVGRFLSAFPKPLLGLGPRDPDEGLTPL